jgi:hypothetical protein
MAPTATANTQSLSCHFLRIRLGTTAVQSESFQWLARAPPVLLRVLQACVRQFPQYYMGANIFAGLSVRPFATTAV